MIGSGKFRCLECGGLIYEKVERCPYCGCPRPCWSLLRRCHYRLRKLPLWVMTGLLFVGIQIIVTIYFLVSFYRGYFEIMLFLDIIVNPLTILWSSFWDLDEVFIYSMTRFGLICMVIQGAVFYFSTGAVLGLFIMAIQKPFGVPWRLHERDKSDYKKG